METSNKQMYDAALRHQTYVLRYSAGVRNKINDLLDQTEDEISGKLIARLGKSQGLTKPGDWERLNQLQQVIFEIRGEAWKSAGSLLYDESLSMVAQESKFYAYLITSVSPVILDTVTPHPETLKAIVTERPFEGRILSDWVSKLTEDDISRINKIINSGIVQGRTAQEVTRDLFGTANAKGTDGITQMTRGSVNMMVRTAMQHITSSARREVSLANADIVEMEEWVSTLDGRTTPFCKATDGKTFKPGEGPQPPAHPGCRSARVMYLSQDIGVRPSKPVTERLLVKEYAAKNDLGSIKSRDDLPRGTKGDYDDWARGRIRELVGQVPAKTTYNDWLKTQTQEFQIDTLGKTRADLFRKGGLTLDKFIDADGTTLTLKEVAQRDAAAFERAGLDVSKFLN
ncbi:phage minor head protein [Nitrosomonas sp. Is35]|uniref:phage minor head protein n=1 Tax=Nitrosomonas sp. Is35 TaxID=3080534 RepID=UPI00294B23A4|nr:phage minor head protein [Nitrosomonas sp. Is35]MDV6347484.1 phage minor head protein [Nitrosomonas sp. Is35]